MREERVTLSAGEQRRVVVLNHLEKGAVTVGEAAGLLGISERRFSAGPRRWARGRKLRYKGVERNRLWAEMTMAAYNLVRMGKLVGAAS
ncbi:MAG TPA: hypothetical protein VMV23_09105 [Candidatus Nanopelagicaceae bacterium]|nr:hypothetical protein [Candidatus Nanopelagicaceae bacterium]